MTDYFYTNFFSMISYFLVNYFFLLKALNGLISLFLLTWKISISSDHYFRPSLCFLSQINFDFVSINCCFLWVLIVNGNMHEIVFF